MRSSPLSAILLASALLLPAVPALAQATTGATSPSTASKMAMPTPTTPTPPHPAAARATAKADSTSIVNINTGTSAQLDSLPQIGAKRTAKIIAGRPYKSVDELVTKKVLSQKLFDKLKARLTA